MAATGPPPTSSPQAGARRSGSAAAAPRRPDEEPPVAAATGRELPDPVALAARVHAGGGTVVAAGGRFDVLHAGHVSLLQAARSLGDCLIVCLNSDESVRRLKGDGRPLNPAADRVALLSALRCVDAVLVFGEDTPHAALQRLRPNLWVKGGDYDGQVLPETDLLSTWGGQAVTVPYLAGRSTTGLQAAGAAARSRPAVTSRVLLLRALGLGDFLTGVPAYRAVRRAFPRHRLALAAPGALADLVPLTGAIDELLPARELEPVGWTGPAPDVAIDLHGRGPASHRLLATLQPNWLITFGGPHGGGFEGPMWRAGEHEVARWCRLCSESGIPAPPADLRLTAVPGTALPAAAALLPPGPGGAGLTLVHPGAAAPARAGPQGDSRPWPRSSSSSAIRS